MGIVMKRLLIALLAAFALLTAIPVRADTPLTSQEQSDVLEALTTIRLEAEELERAGATAQARELLARLDELKPVQFWKEATGVYDTTMVTYGRWKAGGKDYAYCLKGAGETIYVTDTFLGLRDKTQGNYNLQLMQYVEQASVLLHENMHLHHGASEAAAYSEQYNWMRLMGVKRDGTMNGVPNGPSGPRVSVVMQTVTDQLKAHGVNIDDLEKTFQTPALSFSWRGAMTIEETPFYDALIADAPPEMRGMMAAMMPKRGSTYPMRVLVEKTGASIRKATVAGVPGKAGQPDVEIISDKPGEQRIRVRQVYGGMRDRANKPADLIYLWTGVVRSSRAEGRWTAFLENRNSSNTPVYSGSWQMSR